MAASSVTLWLSLFCILPRGLQHALHPEDSRLVPVGSPGEVHSNTTRGNVKSLTDSTTENMNVEDEDDSMKELVWCCNGPSSDKNDTKEYEGIMQECRTEVSKKLENMTHLPNKQRTRNEMDCLMQCTFRRYKAVDDEGNIQKSAYDIITNQLDLRDQLILEKISQVCVKSHEENGRYSMHHVCRPAANQFIHCVYDMMNMHCPKEKQPNNEICNMHREELKMKYNI
ncbi:uncharacterized protein [Periplaneta americana]|uniref:uncharacterized protein n=1 Tax=Periplaneta americana TaxID=6978 RepID=UPI0037E91AB8